MTLHTQKFSPWTVKDNSRIVASEGAWKRLGKISQKAHQEEYDYLSELPFHDDGNLAKPERPRILIGCELFEDWDQEIRDHEGNILHQCENGHMIYMDAVFANGVSCCDCNKPAYLLDMADVRNRTFTAIDQYQNVDWIIRTREVGNVKGMWPMNYKTPADVAIWNRPNVHLFATIHTQADADRLIPELVQCGELCNIGLHVVPHEHIDLNEPFPGGMACGKGPYVRGMDQITIAGANDRPAPVKWVRDIVRQGEEAGVPVWVEDEWPSEYEDLRVFQWGEADSN